jgi:hypothetical protein
VVTIKESSALHRVSSSFRSPSSQGLIDFNVDVNAPKAIAFCWVILQLHPHIILLTYARIVAPENGSFGSVPAHVLFLRSTAALVCLWVLYPREEDYVRAADLSLHFLDAQWSGRFLDKAPRVAASGGWNLCERLAMEGIPDALTGVRRRRRMSRRI